MKRIIVGLSVALCTFAIGSMLSGFSVIHHRAVNKKVETKKGVPSCPLPNDLQEILNVEFCDLMRNPAHFDGRIVRFQAVMLAEPGYEPIYDHVYLGEPLCEPLLMVRDGFHLTSRTCGEVMKTLDSLLMRYDPSYPKKMRRSGWLVDS